MPLLVGNLLELGYWDLSALDENTGLDRNVAPCLLKNRIQNYVYSAVKVSFFINVKNISSEVDFELT